MRTRYILLTALIIAVIASTILSGLTNAFGHYIVYITAFTITTIGALAVIIIQNKDKFRGFGTLASLIFALILVISGIVVLVSTFELDPNSFLTIITVKIVGLVALVTGMKIFDINFKKL